MHNLGNILADPKEYEHDRWIAEQARSEWVPLCPEYPNLKGVTCQRIHEFIDEYTAGQPELDDFQTKPNVAGLSISPNTIRKLSKYALDISKINDCCVALRNKE